MSHYLPSILCAVAFSATAPAFAMPPQNAPAPATLVLLHGKIATVDPAKPEAQAIAIRGDISYTWNSAFTAKEENIKGSLAPGKLADITVLSGDILTIPEEQIPATKIAYTIVGGSIVYRAP